MKNAVTLDDVQTFLEAAKADLEDQQKDFTDQYSQMIAAVDHAQAFMQKQKTAAEKDGKIAVIEKKEKITDVMWEKDLRNTKGMIYRFSPSLSPYEPESLGEYMLRRDQYLVKI